MKLQETNEQDMYVLVAPDGSWQGMTLSPDYETCMGIIRTLHKAKMCESYHEMVKIRGFEILPVKVTIKQNGTAEEGFQKAQDNIKRRFFN